MKNNKIRRKLRKGANFAATKEYTYKSDDLKWVKDLMVL